MSRSKGIGRCTILISSLILLLVSSAAAFAQWQGANHIPDTATANASDNTNIATITAVTTAADGSSATYSFLPIVNNNGGVPYLAGDTLAIKATIGGASNAGLSVNSIISAVTATSVTVIPPTGTVYPVSLNTAATGTLTLVLADHATHLPGMSYSGDVHCLGCHATPVTASSSVMPGNPSYLEPLAVARVSGAANDCTTRGAVPNSACGPIDSNGYLMTGHKNMLRKVLPPGTSVPSGAPMASMGNDGLTYLPSGGFDWTLGIFNGNPLLYGVAWLPSTTDPYPVVLNQGLNIHGASMSYACARCHTTGYRFDGLGPEPTNTTGTPAAPVYNLLTDANLPRTPNGWTSGHTSSWQLTGIQCERCHGSSHTDCSAAVPPIPYPKIGGQTVTTCSAWKDGAGTWHQSKTYQPVNVAATALCIECHRQERYDTTQHFVQPAQLPGQNLAGWPAIPGANSLGAVSDGGSCSVSHSPSYTYSQCKSNGGVWNFSPSMSHGANGAESFLNSPHARFTGTLQQNAQNSPDLSVQLIGTFSSAFSDWGEGLQPFGGPVATSTNNGGCTACHNPHYSTIAKLNPAGTPIVKQCQDCHKAESSGYDFSIKVVNHPIGGGTPLPSGLSSTDSSPCVVCHMGAASGTPSYHYFRINADPSYYTFGPASTWYAQSDTPGNGQPNTYVEANNPTYPAVGLDLDIACGQCHGGGNNIQTPQNTYSLVSASPNAPFIPRAQLALDAQNIHSPFLMSVPPSVAGVNGQPLTIGVTLTPRTGVTQGPVNLSVSGLPANATSSWSANPVIPEEGGTTSTLTITTTSTTAQQGPQQDSRPFVAMFTPLFGMIAIGSALLLGGGKKTYALLALALLISLAGVGCGSSGTTTLPTTYDVTVNATSGAVTVSSTIQVTMK